MIQIREEAPGDFQRIAALLDLAFGGTEEFDPVVGLRAGGAVIVALELVPGCLDGRTGTVRYAEAFGLGDQPS